MEVIQTGTRTFIAYLERREGVDGIWVTAVKGEPFTGQLLKVRPNDVLVRMQVLKHGIALQTRQNGRSSTGHFSVEQVEKWIESSAIPLGWDDIAGASLAKLQRRLGDNPSWARPSYSVITSSLVSSPTSVDVRFADSAAADSTTTGAGPARYTEQRMEVPTRDGTLVPVYIARARQDTGLSAGAPPAVLRFYGAYGVVTDPVYSPATLALLDRGITVILIQPRGGGELGTEWWTSGRREHKERTITDVLDCAEFLASSGVVRAGRLALEAHSAGGLIAAAVLLRRPDLFCTAVLTNPFVDPVSALSDPALPLTASDWDEWGNPLSSTEELERLRSLSPYEGLPADCRALPPMLLVGSLDDMRVSIVEPAKFVARLRDRGATAVLHVRMHSDHTFAGTPAEGRNETAMLLAWICALTTRSREEEQ